MFNVKHTTYKKWTEEKSTNYNLSPLNLSYFGIKMLREFVNNK